MTNKAEHEPLDINDISRLLPHRYPFLLLDRVLDFEFGEQPKVRAIKNVTINEPFFQGHFPGHPVMPGVLIVEAMAQAAGILVHLAREADQTANGDSGGAIFYLVKVDNARFSKTVVPGDQLVMEVTQVKIKRGMGFYSCQALVDGKRVASADIMCAAGKETG